MSRWFGRKAEEEESNDLGGFGDFDAFASPSFSDPRAARAVSEEEEFSDEVSSSSSDSSEPHTDFPDDVTTDTATTDGGPLFDESKYDVEDDEMTLDTIDPDANSELWRKKKANTFLSDLTAGLESEASVIPEEESENSQSSSQNDSSFSRDNFDASGNSWGPSPKSSSSQKQAVNNKSAATNEWDKPSSNDFSRSPFGGSGFEDSGGSWGETASPQNKASKTPGPPSHDNAFSTGLSPRSFRDAEDSDSQQSGSQNHSLDDEGSYHSEASPPPDNDISQSSPTNDFRISAGAWGSAAEQFETKLDGSSKDSFSQSPRELETSGGSWGVDEAPFEDSFDQSQDRFSNNWSQQEHSQNDEPESPGSPGFSHHGRLRSNDLERFSQHEGSDYSGSQASPPLDDFSQSSHSADYSAKSPEERDSFRDSGGSWGVNSDQYDDRGDSRDVNSLRSGSQDDSQASPQLDDFSQSSHSADYSAKSPEERDSFRDSGGSWGVNSDQYDDRGDSRDANSVRTGSQHGPQASLPLNDFSQSSHSAEYSAKSPEERDSFRDSGGSRCVTSDPFDDEHDNRDRHSVRTGSQHGSQASPPLDDFSKSSESADNSANLSEGRESLQDSGGPWGAPHDDQDVNSVRTGSQDTSPASPPLDDFSQSSHSANYSAKSPDGRDSLRDSGGSWGEMSDPYIDDRVPHDARGSIPVLTESQDDSQASPHLDGISRSSRSPGYSAESPEQRDTFRESGGSWGITSDPFEDERVAHVDRDVNSARTGSQDCLQASAPLDDFSQSSRSADYSSKLSEQNDSLRDSGGSWGVTSNPYEDVRAGQGDQDVNSIGAGSRDGSEASPPLDNFSQSSRSADYSSKLSERNDGFRESGGSWGVTSDPFEDKESPSDDPPEASFQRTGSHDASQNSPRLDDYSQSSCSAKEVPQSPHREPFDDHAVDPATSPDSYSQKEGSHYDDNKESSRLNDFSQSSRSDDYSSGSPERKDSSFRDPGGSWGAGSDPFGEEEVRYGGWRASSLRAGPQYGSQSSPKLDESSQADLRPSSSAEEDLLDDIDDLASKAEDIPEDADFWDGSNSEEGSFGDSIVDPALTEHFDAQANLSLSEIEEASCETWSTRDTNANRSQNFLSLSSSKQWRLPTMKEDDDEETEAQKLGRDGCDLLQASTLLHAGASASVQMQGCNAETAKSIHRDGKMREPVVQNSDTGFSRGGFSKDVFGRDNASSHGAKKDSRSTDSQSAEPTRCSGREQHGGDRSHKLSPGASDLLQSGRNQLAGEDDKNSHSHHDDSSSCSSSGLQSESCTSQSANLALAQKLLAGDFENSISDEEDEESDQSEEIEQPPFGLACHADKKQCSMDDEEKQVDSEGSESSSEEDSDSDSDNEEDEDKPYKLVVKEAPLLRLENVTAKTRSMVPEDKLQKKNNDRGGWFSSLFGAKPQAEGNSVKPTTEVEDARSKSDTAATKKEAPTDSTCTSPSTSVPNDETEDSTSFAAAADLGLKSAQDDTQDTTNSKIVKVNTPSAACQKQRDEVPSNKDMDEQTATPVPTVFKAKAASPSPSAAHVEKSPWRKETGKRSKVNQAKSESKNAKKHAPTEKSSASPAQKPPVAARPSSVEGATVPVPAPPTKLNVEVPTRTEKKKKRKSKKDKKSMLDAHLKKRAVRKLTRHGDEVSVGTMNLKRVPGAAQQHVVLAQPTNLFEEHDEPIKHSRPWEIARAKRGASKKTTDSGSKHDDTSDEEKDLEEPETFTKDVLGAFDPGSPNKEKTSSRQNRTKEKRDWSLKKEDDWVDDSSLLEDLNVKTENERLQHEENEAMFFSEHDEDEPTDKEEERDELTDLTALSALESKLSGPQDVDFDKMWDEVSCDMSTALEFERKKKANERKKFKDQIEREKKRKEEEAKKSERLRLFEKGKKGPSKKKKERLSNEFLSAIQKIFDDGEETVMDDDEEESVSENLDGTVIELDDQTRQIIEGESNTSGPKSKSSSPSRGTLSKSSRSKDNMSFGDGSDDDSKTREENEFGIYPGDGSSLPSKSGHSKKSSRSRRSSSDGGGSRYSRSSSRRSKSNRSSSSRSSSRRKPQINPAEIFEAELKRQQGGKVMSISSLRQEMTDRRGTSVTLLKKEFNQRRKKHAKKAGQKLHQIDFAHSDKNNLGVQTVPFSHKQADPFKDNHRAEEVAEQDKPKAGGMLSGHLSRWETDENITELDDLKTVQQSPVLDSKLGVAAAMAATLGAGAMDMASNFNSGALEMASNLNSGAMHMASNLTSGAADMASNVAASNALPSFPLPTMSEEPDDNIAFAVNFNDMPLTTITEGSDDDENEKGLLACGDDWDDEGNFDPLSRSQSIGSSKGFGLPKMKLPKAPSLSKLKHLIPKGSGHRSVGSRGSGMNMDWLGDSDQSGLLG